MSDVQTPARPKRERPKVLRLTDAAAEQIKTVMSRADRPVVGLRVGLKNAGCAGMSYTLDFADKQNPLDEVVEDKGARVLIDPKAVLFLIGTEMDFVKDKMQSRFIFNNPNQTDACGCGESVALKAATKAD
ncbi:MAG: iron-sulfur cluster assembly accessory protein [Alphaproteobacteria bacterium]|nr:iron-sulfur cluster assembly accessory protein [Alphaproteobacteria bacterium]